MGTDSKLTSCTCVTACRALCHSCGPRRPWLVRPHACMYAGNDASSKCWNSAQHCTPTGCTCNWELLHTARQHAGAPFPHSSRQQGLQSVSWWQQPHRPSGALSGPSTRIYVHIHSEQLLYIAPKFGAVACSSYERSPACNEVQACTQTRAQALCLAFFALMIG